MILRLLVFFALVAASGEGLSDNNIKNEIIDRCKTQMGEYGAAMVKSCVDRDISAAERIKNVSEKHSPIKKRCMKQMGEYGFAMVESCIERDIKAFSDIEAIPKEYSFIVKRCVDQMGDYGHAMVHSCAERDIEAEEALKTY